MDRPREDSSRQRCRIHRRKGAFERKKKEKSGKMGSRKQIFAFAERPLPCSVLAAPLNPAASTCKMRHVRSEPSQCHPSEAAARPGVRIVFKSWTQLSPNPVLTPKSSPSRRRVWQQQGPAPAPAHHGSPRRSRALRRAPNRVPIQAASPVPAPPPSAAPRSWHGMGHSTALTTLEASALWPCLQQEHRVAPGRWDRQFGFSGPQAMQSRSAGEGSSV